MSNNRGGAFVGGMILGTVAGAIAGVLLAPRSGRETRQILKKSADALPELAEDLSTSVQLQADRLSETALRNWEGTLTRLKDAIAAGLEATQAQHQLLENTEKPLPTKSAPANRDSL